MSNPPKTPLLIRSNSTQLKPAPKATSNPSPKTVAEEALGSLLSLPLPRTEKAFRSALVMAALIGRQIEADFANPPAPESEGWQTTAPTEPGTYEVSFMENDFTPERVTIERVGSELMVDDPHVGTHSLDRYHAQLGDIRWRKATQSNTASPSDGWQSTPPDSPGSWHLRCHENGFEPVTMNVQLRRGKLMVFDCHLGWYQVARYHLGLTEPTWRKPAPAAPDKNTQPPKKHAPANP